MVILDALFTPSHVQAAINLVNLRNLFHARSVSLSGPVSKVWLLYWIDGGTVSGFKQWFGSPDSKNRKFKSEEKAGDLGHLSWLLNGKKPNTLRKYTVTGTPIVAIYSTQGNVSPDHLGLYCRNFVLQRLYSHKEPVLSQVSKVWFTSLCRNPVR